MNETESKLLQALLELEKTVATIKTASPKPNLLPLFTHLDQLTAELPRGTDPILVHYLQRKSYEKARAFLQERETAKG